MHGAPSVTCPVGRSSLGGRLLLAVWAAGAATWLLWLAQAGWSWRTAAGAATVLACGAAAGVAWRRQGAGLLHWDGRAWSLDGNGPGQLAVALDLQGLLLVRWDGPAGRRWLWLERGRAQPHGWADVRRAVYSPAVPQAPGAEPPSASP